MSIPQLGQETIAAGLALDAAGVTFLGLAVLHSPLVLASLLLGESTPKASSGKPGVSTGPIDAAVAAALQGRVGLICLLAGFFLQFVGMLLPSAGFRHGTPIAVGLVVFEVARRVGVRWIVRNWSKFETSVWESPRITQTVERAEPVRRRTGSTKWIEPPPLAWVRRAFGPPRYDTNE